MNRTSEEVVMTRPVMRISASEALNDIRSGLDDKSIMTKYNLTYRQLQTLFRKMIQAGYVTPLEVAERLCVTESQVFEAFDQASKASKELD
jgi:DNA-binding MarR family transcriptional regulator